MTRMRCLHCGRLVPLENFRNVNEARCACGTFILEPSKAKRVSAPHSTFTERSKPKGKPAKSITVNDPVEECSS